MTDKVRPMFPQPHQYTVDQKGCWNWSAYRNPAGYGQVRVDWKLWLVHRLAWTSYKGSIPETLLVLHNCDNPASKLTLQDVRYVKQELLTKRSQASLAREMGVNRSCICKIANGKLWSSV